MQSHNKVRSYEELQEALGNLSQRLLHLEKRMDEFHAFVRQLVAEMATMGDSTWTCGQKQTKK